VLQAEKKAEAGDKAPAAAAAAKAASPTPGAAAAEEVRPWRGMCGQPCVRAAVVPQDTCLMGCARLAWHLVAVAATHPHTTHTPVHISLDTPHPAPSAAAPQAVPDDPYAFMPKPEDNNQVRGKRRGRGGGAVEEVLDGRETCMQHRQWPGVAHNLMPERLQPLPATILAHTRHRCQGPVLLHQSPPSGAASMQGQAWDQHTARGGGGVLGP
jgi:hypothetical protein